MRQGFLGVALALTGCVAPLSDKDQPRIAVAGPSSSAYVQVGAETGVPAELLAALAYVETRMQIVDAHAHGRDALGILGMTPDDLARGAPLAGVSDVAASTE